MRFSERAIREYLYSLPGKRGIDIPEQHFDRIMAVAQSRSLPIWGQHPTPEQLQAFYDAGAHENTALVHSFYDSQPHPHAPSMNVGEYQAWSEAHKTWKEHGPQAR